MFFKKSICPRNVGFKIVRSGTDEGGLPLGRVSKLCFGPNVVPRVSSGVKLGGVDAEKHEEAEHRGPK